MTHLLFVCTFGRDRSATAAAMYDGIDGITADYGGVHPLAKRPVTDAMLLTADRIICFERSHVLALERRWTDRPTFPWKPPTVLNIANRYSKAAMALQLLISARMRQRVPELGSPTVRIFSEPKGVR